MFKAFRSEKKKNYTCVDNAILKDKRLSVLEKWLMWQLLSFSSTWKFSISGLVAIAKSEEGSKRGYGRDSISDALKHLEEIGYIKLYTERNKKGQFSSSISVYERPELNPDFCPTVHPKENKKSTPRNTCNSALETTKFNQFAQRDYDYASLEQKLFNR